MMQNNYLPSVNITEIEDFIVEIADFKRSNSRHLTIEEIAPKFKSMFRKQDSRISYVVTFSELQGLLQKHGCSIANPRGNYINVYRGNERISQIGFPGWSKEVSRNAISTVRKSLGLIPENGVDAQVFFKGADPLSALIGEYEEPLHRLAYR